MTLAVVERAGDDGDVAVAFEADAAHLLVRRRGDFQIAADAEPAQLAALLRLALALFEALHVGDLDRVLEQRGEIAAVVLHAGRGLVGDLAWLDLVAPAQREAVDAHLLGGAVDQPLHVVVAFGTAGAAIGRDQHRIGEHHLGRDLDQRQLVDADRVLHDIQRRHQRRDRTEIRAGVAEAGEARGEEFALGVERELADEFMVAAVMVGHEALEAVGGPFHRPAEFLRGMDDRHVFGIDRCLHAERAADIAGQHMHLVGSHAEDIDELALHAERALAADVHRVAAGVLVERRDRGARLHRVDDEAAVDQPQPGDVRGLREGLRDLGGIAVEVVERDVAGHVVIELRRAFGRGFARPGDGGQRLDLDLDRFGRILRLRRRFGDHHRERIADEAHLVGRQRGALRLLHLGAVAVLERHDAFERAIGRKVMAGVDREHAGHALRGAHVDPPDDAVGVAAAHEHRIGLAGQVDIVGVPSLALHQDRVLGAPHRLADAVFVQIEGAGAVLNIHKRIASSPIPKGPIRRRGRRDHSRPIITWRDGLDRG